MLLMMKDEPVLNINFDEGKYEILNKKLLPFEMQNKLISPLPEKEFYTKYDLTQANIIANKNYNTVLSFLAHRVLQGMCEKPTPLGVGWIAYLFYNSMCMFILFSYT